MFLLNQISDQMIRSVVNESLVSVLKSPTGQKGLGSDLTKFVICERVGFSVFIFR